MRKQRSFPIPLPESIKDALLEWSKPYAKVVWLDSNEHQDELGNFEAVLACSEQNDKSVVSFENPDEVFNFLDKRKDWLFGYVSYDLKNEWENLTSSNFDGLGFPKLHFFCPQKIIALKSNELVFMYSGDYENEIEEDYQNIIGLVERQKKDFELQQSVRIRLRIHKGAYFEKATQLLHHIHRGDIYEANFCQEFYAEDADINPWETYKHLNEISLPPFACFLRLHDKYLLCASPERYLAKRGSTVVSQPIKGTAPRSDNPKEDQALKEALEKDPKERAENIMITDLVRNDLSKSAKKGSVDIKELCQVYSFKQVHQMISTISAEVEESLNPMQLIQETFPMGSMTGAPKISAMQIIEELEETKRGLYSGAVGYIDPEGNFDFNVVIRSILYNASRNYVSFSVGSAITAKSDPEKEYEECLLKAKAMRRVLEGS